MSKGSIIKNSETLRLDVVIPESDLKFMLSELLRREYDMVGKFVNINSDMVCEEEGGKELYKATSIDKILMSIIKRIEI
ncbi:MAG: hypothetical protein DRH97_00050 [Chloroflexi bacterium]|nr:MAG: hypothetical protein DRH97_00050 [Chloroflexota bacterium]